MDEEPAPATPGFSTRRLTLRPFVPADAEEVHQLLDLVPGDPGMTMDERRTAVAFRATQMEWQNGIGSYAVVDAETGAIVGYAGLQFHLLPTQPLATPEIELFCGMGRAHRGNGYALEACMVLRDHAFETLRLGRIVSVTQRSNRPGVNLLERLGARIGQHPTDADLVIGVFEASGRAPQR